MATYETQRLTLLTPNEIDASELNAYLVRNKSFLQPWEPVRTEAYYQMENAENILRNQHVSDEKYRSLTLYIRNKDSLDIIGKVALTNIVYGPFQSCFLGYSLDEKEINKGKMTEAVQRITEIAFLELGLHRIEANIMPRNIRSIRVVQKLMFQKEGRSKHYLKIMGIWEDHDHYTLLNE